METNEVTSESTELRGQASKYPRLVWHSFRMDAGISDKLDKVAREHGASKSYLIRRMLVDGLDKLDGKLSIV